MHYQLTTLPNGLRVATERLDGMESVTLCISFDVGARQEREDENGLAHLLEHMAFKGTSTRSALKIAEEFDDIGGHINAYTSMEQTVYYARVLKEHLPIAVDIMADILQHSVFDEAELAREQEVIVQEIGMHQDSPEDLVFDYLHDVAYAGQPLGRSILGTPQTVTGFDNGGLRSFMDRHYHVPSMVVTAAGNVHHDALSALVEKHFTEFGTSAAEPIVQTRFTPGEKRVVRDLEQLQVMIGLKALSTLDPDYYKLQLLSTLFGGGMSSRLFQEVRERRGLAYSVQSFLTSYSDTGMFGIYAATSEEHGAELLPVLIDETAKLCRAIEPAELTRAKNQQKASLLMRRESPTSVAEWIARHLQEYGEYRTARVMAEQIDAVTVADIQELAERMLAAPEMALATLGPQRDLPDFITLMGRF